MVLQFNVMAAYVRIPVISREDILIFWQYVYDARHTHGSPYERETGLGRTCLADFCGMVKPVAKLSVALDACIFFGRISVIS